MALVQAARLRLSKLQQRRDAVVNDTKSIMRELNTLATFPVELLSLIFTYANTTYDFGPRDRDGLLPAAKIDVLRRALPLRLGLVCRQWRSALLGTPAAWSYVGVLFDAGGTTGFRHALYVQETLKRSGSSPLDVVICYQFSSRVNPPAEDDDRLLSEEQHFGRIVYLLQTNMARVRSLHVNALLKNVPFMQSQVRDKVLDLLRTPSPALLDLRVDFPYTWTPGQDPAPGLLEEYWHGGPGDTTPLFLPVAPNLRNMRLAHASHPSSASASPKAQSTRHT
ncbi:hypothetical protein AURDEDRAFT_122636 [Auricularia subglabra TFB-10046 SS5]|nr:hypothetical protein AURDEDRAFT_122636 [Auricularia subglabra TFB-10046 SS5]